MKKLPEDVIIDIDPKYKDINNDVFLHHDEMMIHVDFDYQNGSSLAVYDTYVYQLMMQNGETKLYYNPYDAVVIYKETFYLHPILRSISDHVMGYDITWNWADDITSLVEAVQFHRTPEKYGYLPAYTPVNLNNH
jgi:hypothetical protein